MLPDLRGELTQGQWIAAVTRAIVLRMPDEFPEDFAYQEATRLALNGAYLKYLSGDYNGDLYIPGSVT